MPITVSQMFVRDSGFFRKLSGRLVQAELTALDVKKEASCLNVSDQADAFPVRELVETAAELSDQFVCVGGGATMAKQLTNLFDA